MNKKEKGSPRQVALEGLIVLGALLLRWPLSGPEWQHVDERALVIYPLGFWGGDFNPHFFNYPSLQLYFLSIIYYVYYLFSGVASFDHFLAYRYFVEDRDLIAVARTVTTLMAVGTVWVGIRLGNRLYGMAGGFIAGAVLAAMPLHVRFSHLAITDTPALLWIGLALLAAVRFVQEGRTRDYLLATACAGLAAATKYPAVLVVIPVVFATALRGGCQHWYKTAASPVIALIVYSLAAPFTWLDWTAFWSDFSAMGREHLLSASHRQAASPLFHHLRFSIQHGLGWAAMLTVLAALLCKRTGWSRSELVILLALGTFGAFIALAESVFVRYALPLTPMLALLSARAILGIARRPLMRWGWVLLLLAAPLYDSYQIRCLLAGADTRVLAGQWLQKRAAASGRVCHLPVGAGNAQLFDAERINVRQQSFADSYGLDYMADIFELLSRTEIKKPLFIPWNFEVVNRYAAPPQNAENTVSVLEYRHDLCGTLHPDVDRQLRSWPLETQIEPGGSGAVFDPVDWLFVPLAGWSDLRATGPTIVIRSVPITVSNPRPNGAEFFSVQERFLRANLAAGRNDWATVLAVHQELARSPFLLEELVTSSYLFDHFRIVALALEHRSQHEEAIDYWRRAITVRPQDPQPHYHIGTAMHRLGKNAQAKEAYLQGLALKPDDPDLLYNLGVTYMRLGELDESLTVLQKSAAIKPDADVFVALGQVYQHRGDIDAMRASFGTAMRLRPDHSQTARIRKALEQE